MPDCTVCSFAYYDTIIAWPYAGHSVHVYIVIGSRVLSSAVQIDPKKDKEYMADVVLSPK